MMNHLTKVTLANTVIWVFVFLAFYQGYQGAQNIIQFYCWLVSIICLAFFNDEVKQNSIKTWNSEKHWPRWLDITLDIALVLILVWHSWIWTALIYTLHIVIGQDMILEAAKVAQKEQTPVVAGEKT